MLTWTDHFARRRSRGRPDEEHTYGLGDTGRSATPAAISRVLIAFDTAVAVMLEEPDINRAVMGYIGTAGPMPGKVLSHSTTLWSLAIRDGQGLGKTGGDERLRRLSEQLAFAFRGIISFWTAGELPDDAVASNA